MLSHHYEPKTVRNIRSFIYESLICFQGETQTCVLTQPSLSLNLQSTLFNLVLYAQRMIPPPPPARLRRGVLTLQ